MEFHEIKMQKNGICAKYKTEFEKQQNSVHRELQYAEISPVRVLCHISQPHLDTVSAPPSTTEVRQINKRTAIMSFHSHSGPSV